MNYIRRANLNHCHFGAHQRSLPSGVIAIRHGKRYQAKLFANYQPKQKHVSVTGIIQSCIILISFFPSPTAIPSRPDFYFEPPLQQTPPLSEQQTPLLSEHTTPPLSEQTTPPFEEQMTPARSEHITPS